MEIVASTSLAILVTVAMAQTTLASTDTVSANCQDVTAEPSASAPAWSALLDRVGNANCSIDERETALKLIQLNVGEWIGTELAPQSPADFGPRVVQIWDSHPDSPRIRAGLLDALAKTSVNDDALLRRVITQATDDPSPDVRKTAINWLWFSHDGASDQWLQLMRKLAFDPIGMVRGEAYDSLTNADLPKPKGKNWQTHAWQIVQEAVRARLNDAPLEEAQSVGNLCFSVGDVWGAPPAPAEFYEDIIFRAADPDVSLYCIRQVAVSTNFRDPRKTGPLVLGLFERATAHPSDGVRRTSITNLLFLAHAGNVEAQQIVARRQLSEDMLWQPVVPGHPVSAIGVFLARHPMAAKCTVDDRSDQSCTGVTASDVDKGIKLLEQAVGDALPDVPPTLDEVVRLTIFLLKYDPSNYAIEAVYLFYTAHKQQFDSILETQSTADQRLFDECKQIFLREQAEGNG